MSNDDHVQVLGKYVLKKILGKGAMGTVWLSSHPRLNLPVAVKILDRSLALESTEYIQSFIEEGRTAAIINHPNIVRIYDADHDHGEHFLVMEYVDGCNIRQKAKQAGGSLPVQEVLELAIKMTEALKEAQSVGIVHRDIKPENIMMTSEGKLKLADLGIAKRATGVQEEKGYAIGTPHYIPPEQALDARDADHRSDMYSLGATMYHLLTGQVPFDDTCSKTIMMKQVQEPLVHPKNIKPDLPDNICAVICRMMEKNPAERYQDFDTLLDDLNKIKYTNADVGALHATIIYDSLARTKVTKPSKKSGTKKASKKLTHSKSKGTSSLSKTHKNFIIALCLSISVLAMILYYSLSRSSELGPAIAGVNKGKIKKQQLAETRPVKINGDSLNTSSQKPLKTTSILNEALIFQADFNDTNGKIIHDKISNKKGLIQNNPKFVDVPHVTGKAIDFDGVYDFIYFKNFIPVSGNKARSVSLWLLPHKLQGKQTIVFYGQIAAGKCFKLYLENDELRFGINYQFISSDYTMSANTWTHIALTIPSGTTNINKSAKIYINGVLQKLKQSGTGTVFDTGSFVGLHIAKHPDHSRFLYDGLMDELLIYKKDLSLGEIQDLYQRGAKRMPSLLDDKSKSPVNISKKTVPTLKELPSTSPFKDWPTQITVSKGKHKNAHGIYQIDRKNLFNDLPVYISANGYYIYRRKLNWARTRKGWVLEKGAPILDKWKGLSWLNNGEYPWDGEWKHAWRVEKGAIALTSLAKTNLTNEAFDTKITDRKIAEYIFTKKGKPAMTIALANKEISISSLQEIPDQAFKIVLIDYLVKPSSSFTNDDLKTLSLCTDLRFLRFWGCNTRAVTDVGVQHLIKLKKLEYIYLRGAPLTDLSAKHFSSIKSLRELNFGGKKVTDKGLSYVCSNKNLIDICLEDTVLTDSGLKALTTLNKLQGLHLGGVKSVTDKGLIHLSQIKNMKSLHLNGTSVTDTGIAKLKVALPKCKIFK
ncbi:protein kinase [Lentisphaera profundi]|uniref:Protein kinase n=1 Tax=Lentisphaera profundi TaxID=1658616 RepID=A0ABY7VXZ4_9BACT|nr:protein kinase [Lentisphaera profundi]WDE98972.1 protein kinase [Lentisphaera profundi]